MLINIIAEQQRRQVNVVNCMQIPLKVVSKEKLPGVCTAAEATDREVF